MSWDDDYDWRASQHPLLRKHRWARPTMTTDKAETARKASVENQRATPVQLPAHLFIPAGAQALDIRVAADIAANTTDPSLLMSFTCPKAAVAQFIQYAVYSDGQLAANQEFIPRVDGKRVFPFQGDPNDNFKINLGLSPDLSNAGLIQCQLTLNPGETIEWFIVNRNIVDLAMGVRMVGYIDTSQQRINARAGG